MNPVVLDQIVRQQEEIESLRQQLAAALAACKVKDGALEAGRVAEREECAKVCEAIYSDPNGNNGYDCYYTRPYVECADAIRARGDTK